MKLSLKNFFSKCEQIYNFLIRMATSKIMQNFKLALLIVNQKYRHIAKLGRSVNVKLIFPFLILLKIH